MLCDAAALYLLVAGRWSLPQPWSAAAPLAHVRCVVLPAVAQYMGNVDAFLKSLLNFDKDNTPENCVAVVGGQPAHLPRLRVALPMHLFEDRLCVLVP